MMRKLEDAIKAIEDSINNGGDITAIEFSLCSEFIKDKYLNIFIKPSNGQQKPNWLFNWCSDENKNKVILKITLSRPGLFIGKKGNLINQLIEYLSKSIDKKVEIELIEFKSIWEDWNLL